MPPRFLCCAVLSRRSYIEGPTQQGRGGRGGGQKRSTRRAEKCSPALSSRVWPSGNGVFWKVSCRVSASDPAGLRHALHHQPPGVRVVHIHRSAEMLDCHVHGRDARRIRRVLRLVQTTRRPSQCRMVTTLTPPPSRHKRLLPKTRQHGRGQGGKTESSSSRAHEFCHAQLPTSSPAESLSVSPFPYVIDPAFAMAAQQLLFGRDFLMDENRTLDPAQHLTPPKWPRRQQLFHIETKHENTIKPAISLSVSLSKRNTGY